MKKSASLTIVYYLALRERTFATRGRLKELFPINGGNHLCHQIFESA